MSETELERPQVRAVAKWVRISPRKARLVVDHIRGRTVPEARTVLAFTAARGRARGREGAALGRGECGGEPRADRRRPLRLRGARGRRPDHQALAAARTRPRRPDQEAHLPHHDQAFAGRRRHAGTPRATGPRRRRSRRSWRPRRPSPPAHSRLRSRRPPRRRGARARCAPRAEPEAAEPEAETEVAEPQAEAAPETEAAAEPEPEAEEKKEKPKRRAPRVRRKKKEEESES